MVVSVSIKTDTRSAGACASYSVWIGHALAKTGVRARNKHERRAVAITADQLRHRLYGFRSVR